ncbi:MAG: hypothetical protein GWN84_05235 [Gammaproteobacteria bacterium]|nr:hypothetical protein [Gammaproteobacteria bacterium]NIR82365.1 hypothetical protein [Gammaproteobacteria bacterium]NIU03510.1 hypothetical protein [Gammaproteobacteria bacterium]NIX84784.1 hypothetical protein [Gammaproteobacteria bacterium]
MHLENREFVLTRADVKAILKFASRDETQDNLAGVWIDPARSRIFATNGHALAVAQCRGDIVSHEPPRLVPTAELAAALKHLKKAVLRVAFAGGETGGEHQLSAGDRSVVLTIDGKARSGRAPYSLPVVRCPDVRPPPIDHVIPRVDAATKPRCAWATFNAAYLELAPLVAAAVDEDRGGGKVGAIEFWFPEAPLEPAVLLCSSDSVEWTVVMMPVRDARQPARVTADEAIAWAAQIAGGEIDHDPYAVATAWRGTLASLRQLPPVATQNVEATVQDALGDSLRRDDTTPARPKKKRRSRKKTDLRIVASNS